jgi:phenylalanyl-tRNA synthetase alpha chain
VRPAGEIIGEGATGELGAAWCIRALELCGIDPKLSRLRLRFGIDRLAMLKYGIPDLRPFFESDLRWLKHYGFAALDIPTLHEGLSR